jgi:hypothetical protein
MDLIAKKNQSTIPGEKTYDVTSIKLRDGAKHIMYETIDESEIEYVFADDEQGSWLPRHMRVHIMELGNSNKTEEEVLLQSLIFLNDGRILTSLTGYPDFRHWGWDWYRKIFSKERSNDATFD